MLNDVLYQDTAVHFLRRVVEGHIVDPLLLVGPSGTGRRYAVIQAVKEIFCTGDRTTTCRCLDCLQVDQGVHPDLVFVTSPEDKDLGVDAARSVVESAFVYPTQSRVKVFVLEGADRMTLPAANALLKTLEEPPSTARFFLLAESAARVIPTIRSRCGRLNFRPLPEAFVLDKVKQFESDATKALVYTRIGQGSIGRSIQYWGSGRLALRDKALSLLVFARTRDVAGVFSSLDQLEKDLPLTLWFLTTLLHDILMLEVAPDSILNLDVIESLRGMGSTSKVTWQKLLQGLQSILVQSKETRIQLGFHVKALLLETFVGA